MILLVDPTSTYEYEAAGSLVGSGEPADPADALRGFGGGVGSVGLGVGGLWTPRAEGR